MPARLTNEAAEGDLPEDEAAGRGVAADRGVDLAAQGEGARGVDVDRAGAEADRGPAVVAAAGGVDGRAGGERAAGRVVEGGRIDGAAATTAWFVKLVALIVPPLMAVPVWLAKYAVGCCWCRSCRR